ncbi:putative U6 snRNA-associated Sm-like protein LSm2 [Astathelohania contejeani]|uniref:U6 snRNA-associated Sm-like protein LSm2 n=1 Tax=Astathelohania contejeani TaxID=164912 RepID=A0ABQ7HVW5_9MICR|nr:putative U6 snRNA-associated Sm-like protein LSm2 [Thelohania contejeani]
MIFYEFFKTHINKRIELELKNNIKITGTLISIDPFLNFSLNNIIIDNIDSWPGLRGVEGCTIRGSSVKFAYVDENVDLIEPLQMASRYRFIMNEQKDSSGNSESVILE